MDKTTLLKIADYFIATKQTVRQTAKHFGISKSSVHHNLSKNLQHLNTAKFEMVRKILDEHLASRHMRGGLATKHMWEQKTNKNQKKN